VNWLRLKYNIPRLGTRKQEPGESDEKYKKAVQTDEIKSIADAEVTNIQEFGNCMTGEQCDPNDPNSRVSADNGTTSTNQLAQDAESAIQDTADEIAHNGNTTPSKKFSEILLEKLLGSTIAKITAGADWMLADALGSGTATLTSLQLFGPVDAPVYP